MRRLARRDRQKGDSKGEMRIAILIGVSEYAGNANSLPACKQDLDSMAAVVEACEKFDEVLRFAGSVKAADLKTTISQKIDSLRGADVEEIFFYYTGHGTFRDDEFFFVMFRFRRGQVASNFTSELGNR